MLITIIILTQIIVLVVTVRLLNADHFILYYSSVLLRGFFVVVLNQLIKRRNKIGLNRVHDYQIGLGDKNNSDFKLCIGFWLT